MKDPKRIAKILVGIFIIIHIGSCTYQVVSEWDDEEEQNEQDGAIRR